MFVMIYTKLSNLLLKPHLANHFSYGRSLDEERAFLRSLREPHLSCVPGGSLDRT